MCDVIIIIIIKGKVALTSSEKRDFYVREEKRLTV